MATLIATVLTCLCFPALIPLLIASTRQFMRQEVTLTQLSLLGMRVTYMHGLSAMVFSAAQFVAGMLVLTGLINAIFVNSLTPLLQNIVIAAIIGFGGMMIARNMRGVEIREAKPTVQMGGLFHDDEGNVVIVDGLLADDEAGTHDGSSPPKTSRHMTDGIDDDDIEDADFRDVD